MTPIEEQLRHCLPNAPEADLRCYAVLRELAPFYRLPIRDDIPAPMIPLAEDGWEEARQDEMGVTGEYPMAPHPTHGIERAGDGISVIVRGELATFDGDELTRLVLAAHRHHCRVAVGSIPFWQHEEAGTAINGFQLNIHPRAPAGHSFFRHPGTEDLKERCG